MEKLSKKNYQAPLTVIIEVKTEGFICISGNHEGTSEEDFDELFEASH